MGLLEEIQRMRQAGMQDSEIILKLQEQKVPYRAISEAMSQSKIKQAVEAQEEPLPPMPSDMQAQQQNYQQAQPEISQEYSEYPQQEMPPQQSEYEQQNYEYAPGSISSDTIMEISEQVVSEKLSDVRKKLENMSLFKTELETKTEAIEDRLKRIEKIIDALQASVLRKVGDYVTNVEDIKKELIESQKTLAKAIGSRHHSKEHQEHKKQ